MDNESFWFLDVDDEGYEKGNKYDKTLSNMSSPEVVSTGYESSLEWSADSKYSLRRSNSSSSSKIYRSSSSETLGPFVDDTALEVGEEIVVPINSSNSKLVGFGNTVSSSETGTLLGFGNGGPRTSGNSAARRNVAGEELDIMNYSNYQKYIGELNADIEEFSKIIQTLGLFKYYIKNKKNSVNVPELNKRFSAICTSCSEKIRHIEQKLSKINYCNHYIMANEKNLEYLRRRFNLQDSAVKKLKILIDTFNTVVREYTHISKKLLVQADVGAYNVASTIGSIGMVRGSGTESVRGTNKNNRQSVNADTGMGSGDGSPVSSIFGKEIFGTSNNSPKNSSNRGALVATNVIDNEVSDMDDKSLLNEISNRTKDIQILEQNARDLNELFAELNSIIKKRGDNISSLENQILLSSEQIDKGTDYIEFVMESDRNRKTLYAVGGCIVLVVGLLVIPSNLKNIVFKKLIP
ncbi:uncharacterized protein TOT_010000674 [Theileria orientalis strain Shintoku]|uniref:t-SNARE coiled-coil homology domain-containing protein n=1 Tax=Theileria orientalis strain Shintoku TaxID=869250 RepID=J4DNM4_THEOR|nr:uncharacterized protein TOT_010000674 [Theileria orientalis strain Shintoku]BAM39214.1 uncharacterized protein TOT_010000674 [Theileria orientalis strain Shintoku]|eukprot:XP_009689515.1 uncharacterized protein TOT_010000674 [Theileria orientalis strain Shintoku]